MSNFVKSYKSFQNKVVKEQAQSPSPAMNVPQEFQADQQKINNLKNEVINIKQQLTQKEADINKLTQELQVKISAKAQQDAQAAQSTTPPAQNSATI